MTRARARAPRRSSAWIAPVVGPRAWGRTAAVAVVAAVSGAGCRAEVPAGRGDAVAADGLPVDAVAIDAAATANRLFRSNFGPGVSLGPVRDVGAAWAWQDLIGTDAETGDTWPVAALDAWFSGIQLITSAPITPATLGDHIENQLREVPGPTGAPVRELFQHVKLGGPVGGARMAQAPLLIQRPWTSDVPELYLRYWFRYPASQVESLVPGGNWRVQFELKTGGFNDEGGGDYRLITEIAKAADGRLFWRSRGDGVANGPTDERPSCPVESWTTDLDYREPGAEFYWCATSHAVPVPIDRWFVFEVYWLRSDGDDGRYWAAADGQVFVDHRGPTYGRYRLPVTRIMVNNPYSGGVAPFEAHTTGLEIWDGFPCGDGRSCAAPAR